jgi:phospholipase C
MNRSVIALAAAAVAASAGTAVRAQTTGDPATRTPITHVVVLFPENRPFDHYFGTYPNALNIPGEPRFDPKGNTPSVTGFTWDLLNRNPNKVQPFRLGPDNVVECSQTHVYKNEQQAADLGAMDKFVEYDGAISNQGIPTDPEHPNCDPNMVMGYFDGNTVTALWNYAQNFAMSDNSFATTWGSSAVGAINLISGQTHGAWRDGAPVGNLLPDIVAGTVIGNPRPALDDCSPASTNRIVMAGRHIGDLLNAKGITWGWFNGGFRTADGSDKCTAFHVGSNGQKQADYIPHHQPFQYYAQTANQHHVPPASIGTIGLDDQAHHQYDLDADFWPAAESGRLPAVSFIKAPAYLEGHNRYSDALAEQRFLVETINRLQRLREWKSMAILVVWDDSDGLYDHVRPPLVSASNTTEDALTGPNACGQSAAGAYQGRCGYGPRLPFLVISPYAKRNFVDHTLTDQTSVIRFIEDNWGLGRIGDQSFDEKAGTIENMFDFSRNGVPRRVLLDPMTGLRVDD